MASNGHRPAIRCGRYVMIGGRPRLQIRGIDGTNPVLPPAAPTLETATADMAGGVGLAWSAVPNAWRYDIYRRTPLRVNCNSSESRPPSWGRRAL